MQKNYVLDTNVLLQDPNALFAFEDNTVIIPEVVLEELDNKKRDPNPELRANVRMVARYLDELCGQGKLYQGVPLPNNGLIKVEMNRNINISLPRSWSDAKTDNRILMIAKDLQHEKAPVIVVTKDIFLRIKAESASIPAQDYKKEQVADNGYMGWTELHVDDDVINSLYKDKAIPFECAYPNYYFLLHSHDKQKNALAKYNNEKLTPLQNPPEFYGVKLSFTQKFLRDALRDDNIPLVTITGEAGTGKTFLSLGVGLEKVLDTNTYRRMLICRPNIGMGEEIGFLPGTEEEKIAPYMRGIMDNLEQLVDTSSDRHKDEDMLESKIDYLFSARKITTEAIAYLQGRSIVGQYLLISEAANLTAKQSRGIVTRAGEGTKVILEGDPKQINAPYLDHRNNGLSWAVEKMKYSPLHAHITLTESKRSALAMDAAQRMV